MNKSLLVQALISHAQGVKARAQSVFVPGVDSITKPLSTIEQQLVDHSLASASKAIELRKQAWALLDQADDLDSEASRAVTIAGNIRKVLA